MNTGSLKLRDSKQDEELLDSEELEQDSTDISPRMWRVASILVLAVAAFIRLYELGLKPMHHDEGVNGFFLTTLFRKGVYHYDPANYHGPTLYYFALVVTKINGLLFGQQAGLSTVAVRLVPVIFGVGTVWLVLCLRRNIGTVGVLAAAAFIALSPGHVFISRYFIHESHFVFFTLGIVVAGVRYYETEDPLYLLLASVSAALLFATKETAIISAGVLVLALVVANSVIGFWKVFEKAGQPGWASVIPIYNVIILLRIAGKPWWWVFLLIVPIVNIYFIIIVSIDVAKNFGKGTGFGIGLAFLGFIFYPILGFGSAQYLTKNSRALKQQRGRAKQRARHTLQQRQSQIMLARFGGLSNVALWSGIALLLFIFINILFYSSFFSYWKGVSGAIESLQVWAKTGTHEHAHPWNTYLKWLWQEEAPLLLLGAAGAVTALVRGRNRFTVFVGAWAFGILVAYSFIPYKTPWLMINFTVPLALAGGYCVNEIYRAGTDRQLWGQVLSLSLFPIVFGCAIFAKAFADYDFFFFGLSREEKLTLILIVAVIGISLFQIYGALEYRRRIGKALALTLTTIALCVSGFQTVSLNFYHYDDDSYPYVYAHTRREFLTMVEDIEKLSNRAGTGRQTGITITSPDYWPLPWYLRDYEHAGFFGHMTTTTEPLVLGSIEQEQELDGMLGDIYQKVNAYPLRPGVTLVLYAKKELVSP